MSKHRKHRESPVSASPSAAPLDRHRQGIFARQVTLQLLAIVGLSGVLGFTFNAASPVGVRFGEPEAAAPITSRVKVAVEKPPLPAAPAWTNPIVSPPPQPVATQPKLPPPSSIKPPVASTPWSVSAWPANTNPVVVATPPSPAQPNPAPIHWPEAKALVAANQAVLVDVRHRSMFDAGHIPGATSLPEMSPPEEFKSFLSQQATNLIVITYCSSTSCSQSARVANRLVNEFHWPVVRYMTGGYAEYQQAELAKPATPPAP